MLGLLLKNIAIPEIWRAFPERFETSALRGILAWRDQLLILNIDCFTPQGRSCRNFSIIVLLIDFQDLVGCDGAIWEWQRVFVKRSSSARHQVVWSDPL